MPAENKVNFSEGLSWVTREAIVNFLQALVEVRSENPPGNEAAIAEVLAERFEQEDIPADTLAHPDFPGRVNLVATMEGEGDGPTLLLAGHMDTVPIGDPHMWKHDPWGRSIVDGRLYGRGTSDMKGPLAAAAMAMIATKRSGVRLSGNLVLAATADEEAGCTLGAKYLADHELLRADMAIVCEPSEMNVTVGHLGRHLIRINVCGKPAHASRPELGDNAVLKMADILQELRDLELPFQPHALLGKPSICPGTTIHGGTKDNVVPDSCSITIDARIVPGQTEQGILGEIERQIAPLGYDAEVTTQNWVDPAETHGLDDLIAYALQAASHFTGRKVTTQVYRAFTDSPFFVSLGIPTIVAFGPGSVDRAHTYDEFIGIDELIHGFQTYHDIINHFVC